MLKLTIRVISICIFFLITIANGSIFGTDSFFQKHKSKSFFRVDPNQSIVNLICQYGGIILPKSVEKDLKIISAVCHTEDTSIDLLGKQILIKNFTVKGPKSYARGPDLRIGKFFMKWNSYLQPVLEIEVEDMDILIEFVNLILTRNNWHELHDFGFPPKLYYLDEQSGPSNLSAFVRFGNIIMSGEVRLKIKSKPLEKSLVEDIVIDLRQLHALSKEIQLAAEKSKETTGRRGCTTDELYDILSKYFGDQIKKFLKLTATDLAISALKREKGESKTVNDVKKAWSGAIGTVLNYAKSVGEKAEIQVDENLKQFGIGRDDINFVTDSFFKSSRRSAKKAEEDERYKGTFK